MGAPSPWIPTTLSAIRTTLSQLLGGNIDAARSSFIRAISLLQQQGRADAAEQLREKVQGGEAGPGGLSLAIPCRAAR